MAMVRSPETNARLTVTLIKEKNPPFLIFPIKYFSPGCCGSWQNNAKDLESKCYRNIDFIENKVSSLVAQAFGPSTPETGRQSSACLQSSWSTQQVPGQPVLHTVSKIKKEIFHLII